MHFLTILCYKNNEQYIIAGYALVYKTNSYLLNFFLIVAIIYKFRRLYCFKKNCNIQS